jgi:hypothetical protein
MDFKVFDVVLYFVLPVWVVVEIFIGRWLFKAKPDKKITDKYPKKVIFLSQIPFGKTWMKNVAKEDVKLLQSYQQRIRVWWLSVILPLFLIPLSGIFYLYILLWFSR